MSIVSNAAQPLVFYFVRAHAACQPGYGKVGLLWWSGGYCAAKQKHSVYCCIQLENVKDTFVLLARIMDGHWKETVKEWSRGTKASKVAAINRRVLSHANKQLSKLGLRPIFNGCSTFFNSSFAMNNSVCMTGTMWSQSAMYLYSKTFSLWKTKAADFQQIF